MSTVFRLDSLRARKGRTDILFLVLELLSVALSELVGGADCVEFAGEWRWPMERL